jgi:hypothetical protein
MNTIFPKSNLLLMVIKERLSEIEAIANRRRPLLKTQLLKWNAPVVILSVMTVYGIYSNLNSPI